MEKFGVGKRILLAMPDWFLYNETKQRLEEYGFEVIGIPFPGHFEYRNFGDRAYNFIRKVLFRDRGYKAYLKYRDTGEHISQAVDSLSGQIDYALMIRADFYPVEIVKKIKSKVDKLVGYQWDGLDRFSPIFKLIPYFDRFFVFDPYDLDYPNVLPTTNFYFEKQHKKNTTEDIDVYYIANFVRERIKRIRSLGSFLNSIGSNSVIKLVSKNPKVVEKYQSDAYNLSSDYVSYEDNLAYVNRSRILIDFLHNVHHGLSFRIFEALGSQKKLITDNKEVTKYDFYNPENIYIITNDKYEGLSEFIRAPYKPIANDIRDKYSFENWIKYVLDISPHQPISLPKV